MDALEVSSKSRIQCSNCGIIQFGFMDNWQEDIDFIRDNSKNTTHKIRSLKLLAESYEDAKWKYIEDFKNDPHPTCPECGSDKLKTV